MRLAAAVLIALVIGSFQGAARAQDNSLYQTGKNAWGQQHWSEAYAPLREYRLLSYGKRPDVDYMLGTSGCRISDLRIWGGNMLRAMLYAYPLTVESRKIVSSELVLCVGGTPSSDEELQLALIDWPPAGMNAVFKTFYWNDDKQPVTSYPMRRIETFPREHFTERLVQIGDLDAARDMAARLSPSGRAVVSDRLIVISEGGQSEPDLREVASNLDRYVAFLQEEYGIGNLSHYVTIYLLPSTYQVQERARQLHGLDVSGATLGYAYADDLSVVAFVPDKAAGTVLHELFHLLVRSEYGNIPQWLDEGIASLYEVSVTDGRRYWGVDNWRGEILKRLWEQYRPTVEELIRSEWYLLDDPAQAEAVEAAKTNPDELIFREKESARQAAMMAMARYFVLFLQDNGQLRHVFETMRSNDPTRIEDREVDPRDSAVEVVSTSLDGRSLADLDRVFSGWFLGGGAAGSGRPSAGLDRIDKAEPGQPYIATASVNVRRGAGTAFDRIGGIRAGDQVMVRSIRNGWAEISLRNGGRGYVSEQYLSRQD